MLSTSKELCSVRALLISGAWMSIAGSRMRPVQLSNEMYFAGSIFINKELWGKKSIASSITFAKLLHGNWHGSVHSRDLRNDFAASQAAVVSLRL